MFVFLSQADTDILTLSNARRSLPDGFPALRAANPNAIRNLDCFLDEVATSARVVVVRLLGGRRAWDPGFDQLSGLCRERGIALLAFPGDQQPDPELAAACTVDSTVAGHAFEYLLQGGVANFRNCLLYLSDALLDTRHGAAPPRQLPWEGIYHPDFPDAVDRVTFAATHLRPDRPTVGILFYRAHWMSGNTAFIDDLTRQLEAEGCNVLPVFCYSLKDDQVGPAGAPRAFADYFGDATGTAAVDAIISTLSFSMGQVSVEGAAIATGWSVDYLDRLGVPILQAIVATNSHATWAASPNGLSPLDTAMNVAMPEFDGRIITVPFCFKEQAEEDAALGARLSRYVAVEDRVRQVAGLAAKWARLRRKPNTEKRIAFILSNYPTKNARIGNAVGLDTPASLVRLLRAMRAAGFVTGDLPETGDDLMHALIAKGSHDREYLTPEQIAGAAGRVPAATYRAWASEYPEAVQTGLREAWGDPPGDVLVYDNHLTLGGMRLGNVFVGIQPPRGFGDNPVAIYHNPDLPPTHHYLAYYRWLRDIFQADAVVHLGKHGTLEWLPGKSVGLAATCYPEVALADLPNVYPFIINNPGEGAQAKRRSSAVIVDHLIPVMTRAETYNELTRLEQLLDEYYQVQTLDPKKLPMVREAIWQLVIDNHLDRDLGTTEEPDDFDGFLLHIDGYLCELKDSQIRDGLHILGQAPTGDALLDILLALTRLDNLDIPGLRTALAQAFGIDYAALLEDRGQPFRQAVKGCGGGRTNCPLCVDGPAICGADRSDHVSNGDVIERLEVLARQTLAALANREWDPAAIPDVLRESGLATNGFRPTDGPAGRVLNLVAERIVPDLARTTDEIDNVLRALGGSYVPAGPSGAPTRGMANVLPTGRNFYSVDPKTLPSPAAWEIGKQLGDALLAKFLAENGAYPESVGLVVWGTSAMRTHGDDIAEILYLLGVRPVWQQENRRITGLQVIPLEELGRPRIDVTVRISGFFRDAFPNLIHLLDDAFRMVAALPEPPEQNFVAAHVQADRARLQAQGHAATAAETEALYRIFGSRPGTYGAGILPLIDERNWQTDGDLAAVYAAWGGFAYTKREYGREAPNAFRDRFAEIVVAVKNQDNREHDIFDSDDYLQYHGGMIATIRALTGRNPQQYFGDSANPAQVRVRDLADEARRVFRSRVVNPKWIESVRRHGYKGAFELAATVDYLFGYDATAQIVEDWMYDRVTDAYVLDPAMQEFFREKNPWALKNIIERLIEAADRQMWESPPEDKLNEMRQIYLHLDAELEGE